MNWLLIAVLAIFIICGIRGWNRGLLRMLYSLISVILLMVLVSFATPHVTDFLREHTGIHETIQERCADAMRERIEKKSGEAVGSVSPGDLSLPEQVTSYIIGAGEDVLEESGVYEELGGKAADFVLAGISFLAALILAILVVGIIGRALDVVNRIPVIKGINRTLGIFAGLFLAFVIICLLFFFLALISGSPLGETCMDFTNGNPLLEYFYYRNPILEIFSGLF